MVVTTTEYWVPTNNWTKEILGKGASNPEAKNNTIDYLINVDVTTNPAVNCEKGFEATYTCGKYTNTAKSISIAPEALGKTANFDCGAEAAICDSLKLILDDEGTLTLINTNGGTALWSSVEIEGSKVTPDTAIVVDSYKAPRGKYGRNYLLPGETLDISGNEWIGSPSGKYRLMMSSNGLQVVYNAFGCDSLISGDITGPSAGTKDSSAILYTLSSSFTQHIGKMGYVNNNGELKIYPDLAQYYVNSYESIGKYNMIGANIGQPTMLNNTAACEAKCNTNQECAGFVFDIERKLCQIKNKNVYQSNRVIDENYEYHLRNKAVNVDISCPKAVTNEDASFWVNNPLDDAGGMTSTTKCGLAAFTETERRAVNEKKELLDTAVNSDFKSMVTRFVDKYKLLKNNLFSSTASISDTSEELNKKITEMEGSTKNEQYKQLKAMSEDTDFIMMSQNYRHIMWSILAIVIIIATMKIAK